MRARPDILSPDSPKGLEVYQLTAEEGVDSCHIYMESQIFTPDSQRLVMHRHAHPHGGDINNPLHQYLLCDLADGGRLIPLLVLMGPSWCNIHPQYCRSDDPEALCDILVQENHGCVVSPDGSVQQLTREPGCDIHVIRDDGTNLRALPWGRDGVEACRGHQCWRGNTQYAIGSVDVLSGPGRGDIRLIEGEALAYPDHLGRGLPGGRFNDLTRDIVDPRFDHFATDRTGDALIFDGLHEDGWKIRLAQLGKAGQGSIRAVTPLLDTKAHVGAVPEKLCHPHPFFSPDGTMAFFNSNESGDLQAYMLRNFSL